MRKFYYIFGFLFCFYQKAGAATLTYWVSTNPEEVAHAKILVKEWNQLHPESFVKMQPIPAGNSTEEVLLAAVVAKTTPDVCANINPSIVGKFVRADAFIPLDQFFDWQTTMHKRMDEKTLSMFMTKDKHYYQVPWKANPVMVAYNKDLFKSLNLSPPKTYSEFMKVAEVLTRDTDGDGKIDQWAMNPSIQVTWWQRLFDFLPLYIAASEGKTLLNGKIGIFDSPSGVAALEFFAQGFRKGYFPKARGGNNLFIEGKIGMTMVGPWIIKSFLRKMVKKFEFDFIPVPVPSQKIKDVYTYGDPKNISIFSTTKHPKKAWEFVKFLISKKADLLLLSMTYQIPIRKNLTEDADFKKILDENPLLLPFVKQVTYTAPLDDSPHLVQILDYLGQQYEAAAVYGVISPQKALKMAVARVDNIYKYW